MAWKMMTARQLNRRITWLGIIAIVFSAGLVLADNMDPVSTAERLDKVGATGILAFGFLLTIGALIYLIKLQYGKMLEVIDCNTKAIVQVTDAIEHCKGGQK